MNINKILLVALQIATEIDAIKDLQPGDTEELPAVHITDRDVKVDVVVTVTKRAAKGK